MSIPNTIWLLPDIDTAEYNLHYINCDEFKGSVKYVSETLFMEALDRIVDLIKNDDGQAHKEAAKFMLKVAKL